MVSKEPIRHHYIPQFILKNFCFDTDRNQLLYFDKRTFAISIKQPRDIFMVKNLYRDDINNSDDIMKIEKNMARFESETAKIIAERFLKRDEILLTVDEDESFSLQLWLSDQKAQAKCLAQKHPGRIKLFILHIRKTAISMNFGKEV